MLSQPSGRAGDESTNRLGSGWGNQFLITQGPDTLTVERAFFSRSDIQPSLKYRYALDGSETTNTILMGRGMQRQRSKTAWIGDTLAITTVHTFKDPQTGSTMTYEVRRELSLQPPRLPAWPPTLVVETTRAGVLGGPPSTTRTAYNRS